jgi:hypothetical protein
VGFVMDRVILGEVFSTVLLFSLTVSFHRGFPYLYIIWGWWPQFRDPHHIYMNNKKEEGTFSELNSAL